jgi:hypothetical protein
MSVKTTYTGFFTLFSYTNSLISLLLYYVGDLTIHPIDPRTRICPGRETNPAFAVGGEHSRKEPYEQLVNSYPEHLVHISARPVENVSDKRIL